MKRLAALLGSAALVLTSAALAPSAQADPIGSCTASTGTIVAVNFAHWGGPVVRGCGVGSATGYDLLHDAGFTTAGTAHDGPAFVCRLGDSAFHGGTQYPTPGDEACQATPPATAYWSFWIAPAGHHTWTYSPLGAMSNVPEPGEVELWNFGGTSINGASGSGVPSVTPDQLRPGGASAPPSSAHSTSRPPQRTSRSVPAQSHSTTSSGPRPASSSSGPDAGASSTARSTAPRSSAAGPPGADDQITDAAVATGPPAPSGSAPKIVEAEKTAQKASTGSVTPVVLGAVLVVLLGGGAGYTTWRRRRTP